MNRVAKLMLASLRASLCGERVEEQLLRDMERHEWVEFVRLAQQHNVLPLLCDALAPHKGAMPREVFARLAGMTLVAEDKFEQREGVIRRLAAMLRKERIPLMILKGYGISRYYPIPAHRTFSDVDIYNCGRIEEADRVIARELGIEIDEEACLAHPYQPHTLRHYTGALTDIRPAKTEFYF